MMETAVNYKSQLAEITRALIGSATMQEEIIAAKSLSVFYAGLVQAGNTALHRQKHNEVQLKGGFALSSYDAAICLDEYLRTARFIKGTYAAIKSLSERFPGRKLNVLYAGCGPYATLILPVLPLFDKDVLDVLLMDINEGSLRSVHDMIHAIGLENYTLETLCGDAILYQTPASRPLHLVVTETMFRALIREPQVAITENLAPQLAEGGILVPEEISVNLVYTFYGHEPFLQQGMERASKAPYLHRLVVGNLFSINKERRFFEHNKMPGKFESGRYELPVDHSLCPDLCIFTQVRVFGEIILGTAESSITNPHCITSVSNLQPHHSFQLIYDFTDVPGWTCEIKA